MYAASESNPGVRFFEYPLLAIEEQLDEMNEHNECCFIGLVFKKKPFCNKSSTAMG
jgi:hypothetical protein